MYAMTSSQIETMMRVSVDRAVAEALDRLREHQDVDRDIANTVHAAASNAVEQFATLANSQLRLIEADYQRRVDAQLLRPMKIDPAILEMAAKG